ncbi:DUF1707 and DUF4190 domain-containing protein [Streptomyces sp. SCUT-3]|uniref:DUF1707 and DUF4190 domain-containing protein n=1 Tax=Streptomyces sp. SCUT-3 TaxID=2684469 RepID=UPI00217568E2|nr:DUF1707 and DUF4190 domain-containing protein [Streptomyces sp. SCUT-3]
MSLQPWQGGQPAGMRAGHMDRERAVDVLKAAYAEGRLSPQEYEQRIGLAYGATTYGDLARLVADVPQGPVPMMTGFPQQHPLVPPTFLPAPKPPTNGMAVGALVCGVATFVTWGVAGVPAVVLGHMAKAQVRRTGEEGEGMATAGLVLGYLSFAFWAVVLFFVTVVAVGSS